MRLAHGVVIFPGGAGTAEEIFYLLGVLLDPRNAEQQLPVVLTGPEASAPYFQQLLRFIAGAVSPEAAAKFTLITGSPADVARHLVAAMSRVRGFRRASNDSYNFNWLLHVPEALQHPFAVTHDSMRGLALHRDQPPHERVANIRRAFSGIVAGNVKAQGIAAIEREGPFELCGDAQLMSMMDELLRGFAAAGRMKLPGAAYVPCYRIVC